MITEVNVVQVSRSAKFTGIRWNLEISISSQKRQKNHSNLKNSHQKKGTYQKKLLVRKLHPHQT